ncbi:MAG: bifunctional 3'-5' exonuclease/DNA polymerase, partial [Aquificae bacterium]|nr:bifunctional 3'-5' exonuclease/DNA polymerase [Aquificota bacterium]
VAVLREIFPVLRDRLNKINTPHKATGELNRIFGLVNPVGALEMAFLPELVKIEITGMPIDGNLLEKQLKEVSSDYQRSYIEFVRKYAVDPFSPAQVGNWLTSKLKLQLPKTEKGSPSSQDRALKKYKDRKEVSDLLHIRSMKKTLDKLKELKEHTVNGRVYTQFRQIGAPTGRMASSRPNLQNITRELRGLFKAPEGKKLVIADYSQIELRIGAEFVNEEKMIQAFREGKDLHRYTASLILGKDYESITGEERQMAKAINFGLIYGISPQSLMEYARSNYGINITLQEAKQFHSRFFQIYTGFREWHDRVKEMLHKKRQIEVYSLLGRKMVVSRFTEAVNFPIQGTGSDLLKMAVVFFGKLKGNGGGQIVNLVHDEIIVEADEREVEKVKKTLGESMEKAGSLLLKKVPVSFEIRVGDSWGEK